MKFIHFDLCQVFHADGAAVERNDVALSRTHLVNATDFFGDVLVEFVLRVDFAERVLVAVHFAPVGLERLRCGFAD